MYRLPFELTELLHYTILGESADPPAPLNDASASNCVYKSMFVFVRSQATSHREKQ